MYSFDIRDEHPLDFYGQGLDGLVYMLKTGDVMWLEPNARERAIEAELIGWRPLKLGPPDWLDED